MAILEIKKLTANLAKDKARWQPRQNPQADFNDDEKRALLGVILDKTALAAAMAPKAAAAPNFAPAVDWRNHNGNHVTAVKDQKACGSCVSFCTSATVESMASIEKGQLLDLSEADLHFCSSHGASCGGWWPDQAYGQIKTRGVVPRVVFIRTWMLSTIRPYPTRQPQRLEGPLHAGSKPRRSGRENHQFRHAGEHGRSQELPHERWTVLRRVMHVFNDFYLVRYGVYHHVTGNDVGLHCVEVIGYSEAEQCWICKNSWGAGWGGAGGFFKIGYGEAGIDTEFPFWTAQDVVVPVEAWLARLGESRWHYHLETQCGFVGSQPHRRRRSWYGLCGMAPLVGRTAWRGWESLGWDNPWGTGDLLVGERSSRYLRSRTRITTCRTSGTKAGGAHGKTSEAFFRLNRHPYRGGRIGSTFLRAVWTRRCGTCGGTVLGGTAGRVWAAA